MRKLSFLLFSLVLLLFSCTTNMVIPYMQPAAVDMGGYKHLAVASVVPYNGLIAPSGYIAGADVHVAGLHIYSGYRASTSESIAAHATDELYSVLSDSGFFTLLSPERTDSIIKHGFLGSDISGEFRSLGYDAVLIPRISSMSVSETIYSVPDYDWWVDSEGVRHRIVEFDYYFRQIASIDYSITIIDTETGGIISQRTFSDTAKREDILDRRWSRLEDPSYLFRRMIRSFNDEIESLLVPTYNEYDVSLMPNKPKNESVESAYKAAGDGRILEARNAFLDAWESSQHLPSGYNAAILYACAGDYDSAIDLLSAIMNVYSDPDVRVLYRDLLSIRVRNQQAEGQITGESSVRESTSASGNAVYGIAMGGW